MEEIGSAQRDESKASQGFNAALGVLVVSFLTSNFIVFVGGVVCLVALSRPYNSWKKYVKPLWILYVISLGITLVAICIFVVAAAIYGFNEATLREREIKVSFYHWDAIVMVAGLVGLTLSIIQLVLIVVSYRAVLDLYKRPLTVPLISTEMVQEQIGFGQTPGGEGTYQAPAILGKRAENAP